ncbi:MAG TPA: DUF6036 family nucleotidyltransferase [Thermoanaerobaculia bacterium]|nr:DUF6036 family nucleotidyltransferase [Thermoanaerobaculia bacterium]
MNRDYVEMLNELSAAGAEYLVIGAHALAAHGYLRATRDLEDLATRGTIYQMGVDPDRIDIITEPAGVEFEDAWQRRITAVVDGVPSPVIGRDDLIATKRAAGRREDLIDIDHLERQ